MGTAAKFDAMFPADGPPMPGQLAFPTEQEVRAAADDGEQWAVDALAALDRRHG